MRIKFYSACFVALLLTTNCFSQTGTYGNNILTEKPNTPIDSMINGYIEVLPVDYNSDPNKKFPLLIFMEGVVQLGNGGPADLQLLYGTNNGMIPDLVKKGSFPNSYLVNGTTYEFIVIIPQVRAQVSSRPNPEAMASPSEVNDIINYAFQNYRVDASRVYLTGLSLGGGSTWNYAGASVTNGQRLAAIVPFAGASCLCDDHTRDDKIAAAHLPVWTFVTSVDATYEPLAQEYVDSINAIPTHSPDALITVYNRTGADHNSWAQPLSGGSTQPPAGQPDNIYQWMLQYSRPALVQPVFANVNAGVDQTLNLANGSMVLNAHSIGFNNATVTLSGTASAGAGGRPIVSTQWVRVDGNGGTISSPNSLTTTVTGLKPGFYDYQLRATDDQGLVSVDDVKITVVAPAENKYKKVEAENYTTYSGLPIRIERKSIDEGPAYSMGSFQADTWLDYTLSLPTAGMYSLYYRYTSTSGNPVINIISDGVTYTRTLTSDRTWRTDSLQQIHLGSNATIRFLSQGSNWNFNYFELAQLTAESPLPVKFVYFNTQCNNDAVSIRWKTAQEENSSTFIIQRSADGSSWSDIGSLPAAGQSSSERSYAFVDNASPGTAYYRVVEQDGDGKMSMTGTVKSICGATAKLSLYPNPNHGTAALNLQLPQNTTVKVQVVNAFGSLVQLKQLELPAGVSSIPVDISSQPAGVYTITVKYADHSETLKLLKK